MDDSTYERGRFYLAANGFPRFAGSSSGVYLTDTIRTELSNQDTHSSQEIEQAFVHRNSDDLPQNLETSNLYSQHLLKSSDLLDEEPLRQRVTRYFTDWHPLFPFLDGSYLIQCFDNAVSMAKLNEVVSSLPSSSRQQSASPMAFEGLTTHEALVLSAVFKAIFSIGAPTSNDNNNNNNNSNNSSNNSPSHLPTFTTTTQTTMLAHLIISATQQSAITEVFALQGLLAIQLYLYAMRKPRPAMHLTGISIKLAYESGLHRCPERFPKTFTSSSIRDLRKRVFYSLYVLDRLLSAEFGIPLMLSDSDVDTCLPGGEEKHIHTQGDGSPEHPARTPRSTVGVGVGVGNGQVGTPGRSLGGEEGDKRSNKRRRVEDSNGVGGHSPSTASHVHSVPGQIDPPIIPDPELEKARKRLLPAMSLIYMARMIGRAMETFNKSIKHRSINSNEALALRADLDRWWNDIGLDCGEETDDPRHKFSTLFTCLYHQQIINLNRPLLSVSPSKMQHVAALQTTVTSVRVISSHLSNGQANAQALNSSFLFWPGYVDMVFFGSLILVYAGRLEGEGGSRHNARLHRDLNRIMTILKNLCTRWDNLPSFLKIVQGFVSGAGAENHQPQPDIGNVTAMSNDPFDTLWNWNGNPGDEMAMAMDAGGMTDFHFGFESFDLNPESLWAYQRSIPTSPARM